MDICYSFDKDILKFSPFLFVVVVVIVFSIIRMPF